MRECLHIKTIRVLEFCVALILRIGNDLQNYFNKHLTLPLHNQLCFGIDSRVHRPIHSTIYGFGTLRAWMDSIRVQVARSTNSKQVPLSVISAANSEITLLQPSAGTNVRGTYLKRSAKKAKIGKQAAEHGLATLCTFSYSGTPTHKFISMWVWHI